MDVVTERIDYYKILEMSHDEILKEIYRYPMSIPELIDRRIEAVHMSTGRYDFEKEWCGRRLHSFDAVFYNEDRDIKIVPADEYLECASIVGIGRGESEFTFDYFDSEVIPRENVVRYLDRSLNSSEIRHQCPIWTHFLRYAPLSFEGRADGYLDVIQRYEDNRSEYMPVTEMLPVRFPKKYLAKEKGNDLLGFFALSPVRKGGGLEIITDTASKGDFAFSFIGVDPKDIHPSIDDVFDTIRESVNKEQLDVIRKDLEDRFTYAGIKYPPKMPPYRPEHEDTPSFPQEDFLGFETGRDISSEISDYMFD